MEQRRMGAELWYHEAPWNPQPEAALRTLQAQFVTENYDLAAILPQHLAWARESVAGTKEEGDPYGMLEMLEEKLRMLERLTSQPIPTDPEAQIEAVRQLHADSGQGIGNVLDLTKVTKERNLHMAQRLTDEDTVRLTSA